MGVLACEICPKMTFLGPAPTLDPPYLFIGAPIQIKLISTQAYLGKVILQPIVAPLDFSLSAL